MYFPLEMEKYNLKLDADLGIIAMRFEHARCNCYAESREIDCDTSEMAYFAIEKLYPPTTYFLQIDLKYRIETCGDGSMGDYSCLENVLLVSGPSDIFEKYKDVFVKILAKNKRSWLNEYEHFLWDYLKKPRAQAKK